MTQAADTWALAQALRLQPPKEGEQEFQHPPRQFPQQPYPEIPADMDNQGMRAMAKRLAKINMMRPAALNPFQEEPWAKTATPGYK